LKGRKELTVRQRRFVAELSTGSTQKNAAEVAGYAHPKVQGSALLKKPHIREALESELEAQGLSPQYLVARIKDLCEASLEREDGRTMPSWTTRFRGAELLWRLMGADRQIDTVKLTFEEAVSRMLEEAQTFDGGIEVRNVEDSGGGNRTEVVVLNKPA
jgi:hypothetical protein